LEQGIECKRLSDDKLKYEYLLAQVDSILDYSETEVQSYQLALQNCRLESEVATESIDFLGTQHADLLSTNAQIQADNLKLKSNNKILKWGIPGGLAVGIILGVILGQ